MSKIDRYKLINIFLLIIVLIIISVSYWLLNKPCINISSGQDCLYDKKYSIYQPIYFGGRILLVITAGLLLFSAKIFRRWLFFIAPPFLVVTFFLVIDISVYSANVMQITRASMAQLSMYILGIVTIIFVISHLGYDYYKNRNKNFHNIING